MSLHVLPRLSAALLLSLALGAGRGADLPYPEDLLQQRRAVYQEGVEVNYREAVLPRLNATERAALAGARIRFPLHGPGDGLFGYHSKRGRGGNEILLPVKSLRFYSDLCVASAWLWARDYSQSSIYDYLNMLKYGDPADLGLTAMPLPLDALQIPESELEDPRVEHVRSLCFSTGVVFILAHEIGHLVLGHQGYAGISAQQAQANEADADAFALDIMSRLGDLPFGAMFFFTYAAYYEPHRGDFANDADWQHYATRGTHPISGQRLQALADGLMQRSARFAAGPKQARTLSTELRSVSEVLLDQEMQQFLRAQGAGVRPYMLSPRKGHLWQVQAPATPLPQTPFSGFYRGWIGDDEDNAVDLTLILLRKDRQVHGRYSYAGIAGTLKGRLDGDQLVYRYWEPDGQGEGRMRGDTRLEGNWKSRGGLEGALAVDRLQ